MNIDLVRFSYSPTETEGKLHIGNKEYFTIEDPWNNNKPFASCVPEGIYNLIPFKRPSGYITWALENPDLNIYAVCASDELDGVKRDKCLIHSGNFETDISGCIAPGTGRTVMLNPKTGKHVCAVTSSGRAMIEIKKALGEGTTGHTLHVRQIEGAHLFG